jgi:hypothetical protein
VSKKILIELDEDELQLIVASLRIHQEKTREISNYLWNNNIDIPKRVELLTKKIFKIQQENFRDNK